MPIQPSSGCKNILQKCRNLPQINYWISIKLIVKGHETQNDNGKKHLISFMMTRLKQDFLFLQKNMSNFIWKTVAFAICNYYVMLGCTSIVYLLMMYFLNT